MILNGTEDANLTFQQTNASSCYTCCTSSCYTCCTYYIHVVPKDTSKFFKKVFYNFLQNLAKKCLGSVLFIREDQVPVNIYFVALPDRSMFQYPTNDEENKNKEDKGSLTDSSILGLHIKLYSLVSAIYDAVRAHLGSIPLLSPLLF